MRLRKLSKQMIFNIRVSGYDTVATREMTHGQMKFLWMKNRSKTSIKNEKKKMRTAWREQDMQCCKWIGKRTRAVAMRNKIPTEKKNHYCSESEAPGKSSQFFFSRSSNLLIRQLNLLRVHESITKERRNRDKHKYLNSAHSPWETGEPVAKKKK